MAKDTPSVRLAELLERERRTILAGAFGELPKLSDEKTGMLENLRAAPDGKRVLDGLHRGLSRNQALIAAALEGLGNVSARLDDLRCARTGFDVYDRAGSRARVGSARPAFERKA